MRVLPYAARGAQPATRERMHDDHVAHLDVVHGAADFPHPSGVLVAEDVGKAGVLDRVPLALDDVQVGAAESGGADIDDHVPRAGDPGLGDLLDDGVLSVLVQTNCFHDVLLIEIGDGC